MWQALGQVKGEADAVTAALKQLSALLRTHSQRKPQQVTFLVLIYFEVLPSRGLMHVICQASPCHPVHISMHGSHMTDIVILEPTFLHGSGSQWCMSMFWCLCLPWKTVMMSC